MIIPYTNQSTQTLSKELLQFYDLGYLDVEKNCRPSPYLTVQEKERKRIDWISEGMEELRLKSESK